jgi:DNA-binding GntR family transcriptional regulator
MSPAATAFPIARPHRRGAAARTAPPTSSSGQALDLLRSLVWDLGPGTVLAEADLCDELGASRNSVRTALRALSMERVVERRTRVGTSVACPMIPAGPPIDVDRTAGELYESTTRRIASPGRVAALLGVPVGSTVIRSVSVCRHGSRIAVHTVYDPLHGLVRSAGDHRVRAAAVRCDAETVGLLGVGEGTSAVWVEELLCDDSGQPVQLAFDRIAASPDGSAAVDTRVGSIHGGTVAGDGSANPSSRSVV